MLHHTRTLPHLNSPINLGKWFTNLAGDITNTGTESLAVINKTGSVNFMMSDVSGVHTVTSFVYPKGAMNMPFDEITVLCWWWYSKT